MASAFIQTSAVAAWAGLVGKILPTSKIITGSELLVIWIQMVIGSGIAYTGLTRTFFINLTAPFQFATADNNWQEILQPLLPPWLYPGEGAVDGLYNGLANGRQMGWLELITAIPWHYWVIPLLSWGLFILLCYTVMISLINLAIILARMTLLGNHDQARLFILHCRIQII